MYLISWNPDQRRIEASLGGNVTYAEAQVFADNLVDEVAAQREGTFSVLIDYSVVRRIDPEVRDVLNTVRDAMVFAQASKITIITPSEEEACAYIDTRLQAVLEGKEEYVAYALAA